MNQVFLNLLVNAAHAIGEVTKGTQAKGKITVRTRPVSDRVGRGAGQGLAVARSIVVEKHGGSLTFEPNGTQGTTFVISVPIESVATSVADD
jgi:signal transduction histidine kinase